MSALFGLHFSFQLIISVFRFLGVDRCHVKLERNLRLVVIKMDHSLSFWLVQLLFNLRNFLFFFRLWFFFSLGFGSILFLAHYSPWNSILALIRLLILFLFFDCHPCHRMIDFGRRRVFAVTRQPFIDRLILSICRSYRLIVDGAVLLVSFILISLWHLLTGLGPLVRMLSRTRLPLTLLIFGTWSWLEVALPILSLLHLVDFVQLQRRNDPSNHVIWARSRVLRRCSWIVLRGDLGRIGIDPLRPAFGHWPLMLLVVWDEIIFQSCDRIHDGFTV